jgi:hypothetical protein
VLFARTQFNYADASAEKYLEVGNTIINVRVFFIEKRNVFSGTNLGGIKI